jgi:cellulose synthase/poly-beta-1,6-N-acetylglucosamine synthase-like glycosyltransferase
VRGVTYGTFAPGRDGNGSHGEESGFPHFEQVGEDFARMAAHGVNAVRTYTVPPPWLLDLAEEHGLYVMVGLPWEEHVTFLDEPARVRSIKERIRTSIRACAGHPAVLCYAIGNEIPSSIVRWHGRHKIERFLEELYRVAKKEDPGALVTYVNYPSTEYLQLPFVDIVCFNVFLESGPQFEAYISRLQNIAGDKPLIVTETGLDSRSHSEEAQARALDWQVRSAFASGCAGVFVFSWTDEWHRGGFDVEDWDFGLVDRGRRPKKALATVARAFAELPFPNGVAWPRISVVVCAFNAADTMPDCLNGLRDLDYPDYEVIVVNDGSTDETEKIAQSYAFRLITTANRGLASARNAGLEASTGEIVAYLDADASPDRHWLLHLAASFLRSSHVGVGGPNIPPPGCSSVAECVANAPGGPTHVLLSDLVAEHIPGCNMAFRKTSLEAIGGFDPQFRIAGDDVDICWQLQDQGWTVGFSPGAVVWHHRRDRVGSYLKQQFEYGKAEALLERKWPDRYNRAGHLSWAGRVYGNGATKALGWRRWKIYYGRWGTGLFQSVYQRAPGPLASLPLVPEWYLVIAALAALSALSVLWMPLLLALPLLLLAGGALAFESMLGAARASFSSASGSRWQIVRRRGMTALLYMLQPAARLGGRMRHGLAPWRRRSAASSAFPWPRTKSLWSEEWTSPDEWLESIEAELRRSGCAVLQGGEYDRWDLNIRGGTLGAARLRMAVEEHGGGRQLVRVRSWPRYSRVGVGLIALFAALAAGAVVAGAVVASVVLGAIASVIAGYSVRDCATGTGVLLRALGTLGQEPRHVPALSDGAPQWEPAEAHAVAYGANGARSNGHDPAPVPSLGELPSPQVLPFSSAKE